jgi:LytR cell envelope-related transcriptional attenuator
VTIPGRGDLSPRRKHRNWRRRFAVTGVLVVVLGGGYFGYQQIFGGSAASPAALPPCPAATPTTPTALQAKLVVKNATLETGLAGDVARQLRRRDFHVASIGNTPFRGKGVATVLYSADRLESAQLVATQFAGATMQEVDGTNVLEVDIGPKFESLVPAAQASAAEKAVLGTPTPTPSASPTCTP